MKILLFLALWLMVLVVSCSAMIPEAKLGEYQYTHKVMYQGAPKRVIPIWVDKNFSLSDQASIKNAIDSWNYSMNGYIKLELVDLHFDMEVGKILEQVKRNGWLFMKIGAESSIVPVSSQPGYHTIGFTDSVGGNHLYIVRERLIDTDVYGVMLHEIGHLMGSGHVGVRLMYPHYSRAVYQCIDFETIQAVAEYQKLEVNSLNYCTDNPGVSDIRVETPKGGYTLTL